MTSTTRLVKGYPKVGTTNRSANFMGGVDKIGIFDFQYVTSVLTPPLSSFPPSFLPLEGRQMEAKVTRAQESPLSCLLRTQMRLQFPVAKEKFRGRGRKCSTSFANNGSKEFHFKGIEGVLDGVNYRLSSRSEVAWACTRGPWGLIQCNGLHDKDLRIHVGRFPRSTLIDTN